VRGNYALQLLVGLLGLVLGSCGPHNQPAAPPTSGDYFPMRKGDRWEYEVRSRLGKLHVRVEAKGELPVGGQEQRIFVMEETSDESTALGFVKTSPVGYVQEDGYVARILALDYDDDSTLRLLGRDKPTRILPLDPKPGDTWDQESSLFTMPDGKTRPMGWSGEVKTSQPVRVPAGTFSNVVEIDSVYHEPNPQGTLVPSMRYMDYYARGVGLVRSVTEDVSGEASKRVEWVLLSYSFAD